MEPQVNSAPAVTQRATGVRFGIVTALLSIVYFLIMSAAGLDVTSGVWRSLGWVITIVVLIFAHKYFREKGDGYMSYGQGIGVAFWMGLVHGGIYSVFVYLYIKLVDSSFLEMIREKQIEAMEQQGLSQERIDKALEFSSMFFSPEAMLIYVVIGSIVSTVFIALFVTIFTQKKNPEPAF